MRGTYSQALVERQREIDRLLKRYVDKNRKELKTWLGLQGEDSALYQFLTFAHIKNALSGLLKRRAPMRENDYVDLSDNRDIEGVKAVLGRANDTVAAWGGKMHFVYLPTWSRYYFNKEDSAYDKSRILEAVASLDIPIIDVSAEFRKVANPLELFPYERHGHYLPKGYEIISRMLAQSIEARKDQPAKPEYIAVD